MSTEAGHVNWTEKSRDDLKQMQKSVISSALNIARTFKIVT